MRPTIGLLEFNSIADGIKATDAMLKASDVRLLTAKVICPGKYIALVSGAVGAVKPSIRDGKDVGGRSLIDELVIPRLHPDVIPAITATTEIEEMEAVGVIETFTIASSIICGDKAAKSGDVDLIEIRLGTGMAGKSFASMTGEVAEVKNAVAEGSQPAIEAGALVEKVVIPKPIDTLSKAIM